MGPALLLQDAGALIGHLTLLRLAVVAELVGAVTLGADALLLLVAAQALLRRTTVVLPVPIASIVLSAPVVTALPIRAMLRLGRECAIRPLRRLPTLLLAAILLGPRRWSLDIGPPVGLVAWRLSPLLRPSCVIRSSCGALLAGTPGRFGPDNGLAWLRSGILSGPELARRTLVSRILVLPCGRSLTLAPLVLHLLARFGDSFLPVILVVGFRPGLALFLLRGIPVPVLTLRAGRQGQPQREDRKRERPQDFMVARKRHVGSSAVGANASVGLLPTIWPRA
jgi:hypothetical protein